MNKRDLSYTERDYEGLKNQLQSLAEQYFPSTFKDFSEYSVETMLMEMVAYTGDVLNFYLDDRFRQVFVQHANDIESVFRLAKSRGYKPNTVSIAYGEVRLSQEVDALNGEVDLSKCSVVYSGAKVSDRSRNRIYTTLEQCNFKKYTDAEVIEESAGVPTRYRVSKNVKVRSGEEATKRIEISATDPYPTFLLDSDVAYVTSIEDSDGNHWFQVDYLAQDTIFEGSEIENYDNITDQIKDQTPFVLNARRVSRRYEVDHNSDGKCYLKFGSGVDIIDETSNSLSAEDLLTTNNIAQSIEGASFSIDNFLRSDSFGIRPYNTTLFVKYVKSRGEEENINSNRVNEILNLSNDLDLSNDVYSVTNPNPITGGSFNNNIEKIKSESSEAFFTQRRCVTTKDYILRTKLLPSIYGNISKVYAERDFKNIGSKGVNLYVLSKDIDGNLQQSNNITKNNLRKYLREYKISSDRVNILDPFIINIGIDFKFLSKSGFNNDEVLLNISREVAEYFNTEDRELNEPIIVGELIQKMDNAEGVVSITDIQIINKFSQEYSNVVYDTSVNGENFDNDKMILYPPLDVGIFELKFPSEDIRGEHV